MSTRLEEYEGASEIEGHMIYEPGWYLLLVEPEPFATLARRLEPLGMACRLVARPHVSVAKGEAPSRNQSDWGTAFVGERVRLRVGPGVRDDNGLHLWVDCHGPRLCELREHFGLVTLRREDGAYLVNFHMTIGRRKKAVSAKHRPQLRLFPQSHIDVETGMQHL